MEWIKPWPTSHTFIVVLTNPAQCFKIAITDIMFELKELRRFDVKLLSIIFLFIAVKLMTEDWIILQIILSVCKFL